MGRDECIIDLWGGQNAVVEGVGPQLIIDEGEYLPLLRSILGFRAVGDIEEGFGIVLITVTDTF